jgi:group I intron endonuclease
MLLFAIIIQVITIPLAYLYLSPISIRFAFLVSLSLCYILEILGGLFQTSPLFQIPIMFPLCTSEGMGGFSLIEEPNILFSIFVPIMIYNADKDKSQILTDLKGKAGIYMWIHKESGKRYIGSAFDLSSRLGNYLSKTYLKKFKTVYIYNALLDHGYSAFSLSILEFIEISNLSKEEARKIILEREQYYLDQIFSVDQPNTYNILQVAGSVLGFKHTQESLAKMSEAKTGVNHPLFGKFHSAETKAILSEVRSGENNPMFGKFHSIETITKISTTLGGGTIYVYDSQDTLVNTFCSARKAAEHFGCNHKTILSYVRNQRIFRKQWILSKSLID